MDPRRLRLLLELSRRGSMRAVADALGFTTSTVSQQIAVLAREAGTPLIEPVGRRVRLTPAGHRLTEHAVTILAALDAARADLDPEAEPAGVVRVAGFATAIRRSLVPVVAALAETHPAVELQIREHEPTEAMALLADDDVDLALVYDYSLASRAFERRHRRHAAVGGALAPRPSRSPNPPAPTPHRRSCAATRRPNGSSTRATPATRPRCWPSRRWPGSSRASRTAPTASSSCRTSSSPASASGSSQPTNRSATGCIALSSETLQPIYGPTPSPAADAKHGRRSRSSPARSNARRATCAGERESGRARGPRATCRAPPPGTGDSARAERAGSGRHELVPTPSPSLRRDARQLPRR